MILNEHLPWFFAGPLQVQKYVLLSSLWRSNTLIFQNFISCHLEITSSWGAYVKFVQALQTDRERQTEEGWLSLESWALIRGLLLALILMKLCLSWARGHCYLSDLWLHPFCQLTHSKVCLPFHTRMLFQWKVTVKLFLLKNVKVETSILHVFCKGTRSPSELKDTWPFGSRLPQFGLLVFNRHFFPVDSFICFVLLASFLWFIMLLFCYYKQYSVL